MNDFYKDSLCKAILESTNQQRPLYLIMAATKPCFIKLASLVHSMKETKTPHLLVLSGQHWDQELSGPLRELQYEDQVSLSLNAAGAVFERQGKLAAGLEKLWHDLRKYDLREPAVPIVSGDTWSAGFIASSWLVGTGIRSVHVEAGLRSEGPDWTLLPTGACCIEWQQSVEWIRYPNEPFPEGICTRLASISSQTLFAPTPRNAAHLKKEGYLESAIALVGSLSADAVNENIRDKRKMEGALTELMNMYPELRQDKWLRVDLHRRENMRKDRLLCLFTVLKKASHKGIRSVLVQSNAFRNAIQVFHLEKELHSLRRSGILITSMWPSYFSVLAFLQSAHCLAVYTDSGGLQEETHVLGVPCLTARNATDRAETIFEDGNNILVPLNDADIAYKGILRFLEVKEGTPTMPGGLYGKEVGHRLTEELAQRDQKGVSYRVTHGLIDW